MHVSHWPVHSYAHSHTNGKGCHSRSQTCSPRGVRHLYHLRHKLPIACAGWLYRSALSLPHKVRFFLVLLYGFFSLTLVSSVLASRSKCAARRHLETWKLLTSAALGWLWRSFAGERGLLLSPWWAGTCPWSRSALSGTEAGSSLKATPLPHRSLAQQSPERGRENKKMSHMLRRWNR